MEPEDVGILGGFKKVERGNYEQGGDLRETGLTDKATSRLGTIDVSMEY